MDWLDFLQWPAMLMTLLAAWLVASHSAGRRNAGFWLFLTSNALWALNIRGALKTEDPG